MVPPAQSSTLNYTQQAAFLDRLDEEIASMRPEARRLGLLLVQLSNTSELNRALGYRIVDAALAALGARLANGFNQRVQVVRIGTTKFAIVLRDLKADDYALLAAKKVERLLEEPLEIQGIQIKLDVAQGIALAPRHAEGAEGLLQSAESALSAAKESDVPLVLYSPEADSALSEFGDLDRYLTQALEQGGIEVFFQPQIDVRTGRLCAAEALLRCRDEDGNFLPPERVIEVAQQTRRLAKVTTAVLNSALRFAADWPFGDCNLSVNISTQSLKDPDLVPSITNALRIWNWAPQKLTIEITESVFIDEPDRAFSTMVKLREVGMRVAIDDFGTGYSSLSYFKNIPANELKIDKSFVINMMQSDADRRIVHAVINLAHAFDLTVVAEGVEDHSSLAALRAMDCDIAQGFGVGRPMPQEALIDWVKTASAA